MENIRIWWEVNRVKVSLVLLCLLAGWTRFELKLISVKQLVTFLPVESYAYVLVILALSYFSFFSLIDKYKNRSHGLLISFGLIILPLAGYQSLSLYLNLGEASHPYLYSFTVFALSTVCVTLLDALTNNILNGHVSIFSGNNAAGRMTFFIELGFFISALAVKQDSFIFSFLGPLGALLLLVMMSKLSIIKKKIQPVNSENLRDPPYFGMLVTLFLVFAFVRNFQSFLLFLGLKELVEQGTNLTQIFSSINLAQSGFILLFLSLSFRETGDKWSWRNGFAAFNAIQMSAFAVLLFSVSPWALIFNESFRKVTENSILSNYKKKLDLNFPGTFRWQIQARLEKWSNSLGLLCCSILVYLMIQFQFPMWLVGIFFIGILGINFLLLQQTFEAINEFQVSELAVMDRNKEPFNSVQIIQNLGYRDCKEHSPSMIQILNQNERPIIVKSAVKSLVNMSPKDSSGILLEVFNRYKREDVRIAIMSALRGVKDYNVDLFVIKEYEKNLKESLLIENLQFDLLKIMCERVQESFILSSLRIYRELDSNEGNMRVVANLVEVLGHLAEVRQDILLFEFFMELYNKTIDRRIKANLLRFLYLNHSYRKFVKREIEALMTSVDQHDRNAVIYIIGKLRLNSYLSFVMNNLKKQNLKSSPCLISLLELKHPEAEQLYCEFIFNVPEEEAIQSLNQFHGIQKASVRMGFYDFLFKKLPHNLEVFLSLLKRTNKDFDLDRKAIYQQTHFNS